MERLKPVRAEKMTSAISWARQPGGVKKKLCFARMRSTGKCGFSKATSRSHERSDRDPHDPARPTSLRLTWNVNPPLNDADFTFKPNATDKPVELAVYEEVDVVVEKGN